MRISKHLNFIILISHFFFACNSTYTSKKTGYYRIDLPEHAYQIFNEPGFPYSFEYPVYGKIVRDSSYFDIMPDNDSWVNIDFPQFDAKIFLSYKIIGGQSKYKVKNANGVYVDSYGINSFDKMVTDAYNLTAKNEILASSSKDSLFTNKNGVSGVLFKVGGNVATATQFFMSDTSKNFLRGALYFNTTPKADSLKPVQAFLDKDILRFIETFKWK